MRGKKRKEEGKMWMFERRKGRKRKGWKKRNRMKREWQGKE